uniref:RING-type domain-containing protein n=1 Tax=Pristionchus pacificus TaxID=54126 RepID=A0A8R1UPU8_PRIPA
MPSTHRQSSLFNWLDKSSSSSLQSVHNPAIAKSEPRTPRTLKTPTTPRIPKIPRTLKTALTPRQIVAQMLPKSIMTPKVFKTPRSIGRTTGMMKKTEPVCAICTKELIEMRNGRIGCGHRFHRTCILKVLETKENTSEQNCPICKAPYGFILCGRSKIDSVDAFGDLQQPGMMYARRMANAKRIADRTEETEYAFVRLVHTTALETIHETLEIVRSERIEAEIFEKSDEFMNDIDEEIEKLEKRKKIFIDMQKVDEGVEILLRELKGDRSGDLNSLFTYPEDGDCCGIHDCSMDEE